MDYEGTAVLDHDTYAHFGGGFATYRGVVKFPMSGYRDGPDGAIVQIGAEVQHWTSSLYNNMGKAPYKEYMGDYCLMLGNTGNPDTDGLPVRCVKD
jgi:hypothetical protein